MQAESSDAESGLSAVQNSDDDDAVRSNDADSSSDASDVPVGNVQNGGNHLQSEEDSDVGSYEEEDSVNHDESHRFKQSLKQEEEEYENEGGQSEEEYYDDDEEKKQSSDEQQDDSSSEEDTNSKRKRIELSIGSGSDMETKKVRVQEDETSRSPLGSFDEGADMSSDGEKHMQQNNEDQDAASEPREDGEVDEDEDALPETRIEVDIPRLITDLGREIHFVKLPNFLSVDPRPFDPDTYEDEIDDEETLDEEGRARLKLKVGNTLRWRSVLSDDGHFTHQSNAHLVRWSDGSMSLLLGSEAFDVCKQPLQGDHNHLFLRQGTGLQGQAVFRTKLSFRPHSTESLTHRKMTLSLADRSQKKQKVKLLTQVSNDPEAHRGEMIKREEDRLRASLRRESRQRRIRDRLSSGRAGLTASYLEPDRDIDDSDDEGAISLAAIKNRYKKGVGLERDDDASDIEIRKAKRLEKAKALRDSDEDSTGAPISE